MPVAPRIYLDNAATSWPKCQLAVEAAVDFIRNCGATTGRGTYASGQVADRWLSRARLALAQIIGAGDATSIAVCSSGTHALNAALRGVLRPGDHVVATRAEHNSVLRPLEWLRQHAGIQVDYAEVDHCGRPIITSAVELAGKATRLICVGHASNVTGAVTDLRPWQELASNCSAKLMVDASQTLGYHSIDVKDYSIDILCAAGHKGLGGLQGTGFLCVADELQESFSPLLLGGTGLQSESIAPVQPWPNVVEAGNLNLPGIVSMAVAAETLLNDTARISCWRDAFARLIQSTKNTPNLRLVGWADGISSECLLPEDLDQRIPVASYHVAGWSPHDLAAILSDVHGIEVRAGLHCAGLIHACLTEKNNGANDSGTLRVSPGHNTTLDDIDQFTHAINEITAATA